MTSAEVGCAEGAALSLPASERDDFVCVCLMLVPSAGASAGV